MRLSIFSIRSTNRSTGHCREWIEAGKVANPVTLKNLFGEQRFNDQLFVWQYLATLQSKAVPAPHLPQYAQAIVEVWAKRRLAVIADALKDGSLEPEMRTQRDRTC